MNDQMIRLYLPGFMILFTWVVIFWRSFKKVTAIKNVPPADKAIGYKRMKRIHTVFRGVLLLFVLMTVFFVFFPKYYSLFLPIEALNHPGINITGCLILKASLIWVIIIQLRLDEALFKYSRNIDLPSMELVFFCERLLVKGMLVMFIGMFVTISNVTGLLLCVTALACYYKRK